MTKTARCELCCCAATWLCVGTLMLILFAFDYAAGDPGSPLRLPLIVAAGIAFVLMIMSVAIAIQTEPTAEESGTCQVIRRQVRRLHRRRAAQPSAARPGS